MQPYSQAKSETSQFLCSDIFKTHNLDLEDYVQRWLNTRSKRFLETLAWTVQTNFSCGVLFGNISRNTLESWFCFSCWGFLKWESYFPVNGNITLTSVYRTMSQKTFFTRSGFSARITASGQRRLAKLSSSLLLGSDLLTPRLGSLRADISITIFPSEMFLKALLLVVHTSRTQTSTVMPVTNLSPLPLAPGRVPHRHLLPRERDRGAGVAAALRLAGLPFPWFPSAPQRLSFCAFAIFSAPGKQQWQGNTSISLSTTVLFFYQNT